METLWPVLVLWLCIVRSTIGVELDIVSRDMWSARPPKERETMVNPVPYVIIHHTYIPGACQSQQDCTKAVQYIQNMHMDDNGWSDIGYSFLVGGDLRVYTGRGWNTVGAHAPSYNNISIGICFIGDYQEQLPPARQLEMVKSLIQMGIDNKEIRSNYTLLGHRQTRPTECPGQRLYEEIITWPHYSPVPEPPPNSENLDPVIITREEWEAEVPKKYEPMLNPARMVIISHSYISRACKTKEKCKEATQQMQRYHMKIKKLNDIAYNFVVGDDQHVYEGTGWSNMGSHFREYNNISIGICIIGNYKDHLPSALTIYQIKKLISYGIKHGYIHRDYILAGHRELIPTGDRLLNEIQTWPHYCSWDVLSLLSRRQSTQTNKLINENICV